MKAATLPETDLLRQMFSYDADAGLLRWKIKPAKCILIGDIVGYRSPVGYVQVTIAGQHCLAHRIIWKIMTGEEPAQIDHINSDRSDNRFANLRPASQSQNRANGRKPKTNTSGFKGTSFKAGKWEAGIKVNGKTIYLGRFGNVKKAHKAYLKAAYKHFGEYARAT